MKLAVSNIAWPARAETDALAILRGAGIEGVEVAPTRLWPNWRDATGRAALAARSRFAADGFPVVALQAILFAKPACKLFGTDAERCDLVDHLQFCAELARDLGAPSLVFGAPKNREKNGLSDDAAFGMARECFATVAAHYERLGVCLCIEANPPEYGCQFLTDSAQAARMVRSIASAGIRLHLDTACMHLSQEDIETAIRSNIDLLAHFHVSEPFLGGMEAPAISHFLAAGILRQLGYTGWVSLEMREGTDGLAALHSAVQFFARTYGGD